MDMESIETFIKVAETRSFSRSAEVLQLTQPAVSKRIAALESKLDARLFDRVGRNIHLTEAGQLLLPSAKQLQSEVTRIEDEIRNAGKAVSGRLLVGTTAFVTTKRLKNVLTEFHENYKEVNIELKLGTTEEALDGLLSNSLELALCPLLDSSIENLPESLNCIELWRNNLKLVVSRNHPLALQSVVTPDQLSTVNAILPSRNTLARKAIDIELLRCSIEGNVATETQDFATMRTLASIGLGWTCLPQNEIDNTLVELPLTGVMLPHSIVLVHRRERSFSRAGSAFIEALSATSTDSVNVTAINHTM